MNTPPTIASQARPPAARRHSESARAADRASQLRKRDRVSKRCCCRSHAFLRTKSPSHRVLRRADCDIDIIVSEDSTSVNQGDVRLCASVPSPSGPGAIHGGRVAERHANAKTSPRRRRWCCCIPSRHAAAPPGEQRRTSSPNPRRAHADGRTIPATPCADNLLGPSRRWVPRARENAVGPSIALPPVTPTDTVTAPFSPYSDRRHTASSGPPPHRPSGGRDHDSVDRAPIRARAPRRRPSRWAILDAPRDDCGTLGNASLVARGGDAV